MQRTARQRDQSPEEGILEIPRGGPFFPNAWLRSQLPFRTHFRTRNRSPKWVLKLPPFPRHHKETVLTGSQKGAIFGPIFGSRFWPQKWFQNWTQISAANQKPLLPELQTEILRTTVGTAPAIPDPNSRASSSVGCQLNSQYFEHAHKFQFGSCLGISPEQDPLLAFVSNAALGQHISNRHA